MPGTWPGQEKLSCMKYQIVVNAGLLCNRLCSGVVSHAFALICQYLSSTVRDLCAGPGAVHFLSTE